MSIQVFSYLAMKQKNCKKGLSYIKPGMVVADIGTGSGAIAVTLACESKADLYAIDISKEALKTASHNAKKHEASVIYQGRLVQPLIDRDIQEALALAGAGDVDVHRAVEVLGRQRLAHGVVASLFGRAAELAVVTPRGSCPPWRSA